MTLIEPPTGPHLVWYEWALLAVAIVACIWFYGITHA